MLTLNEDWFDDITETGDFDENDSIPSVETEVVADTEIEPEGPQQGEDTGIANIIHDLIIDENEAIQGYNNAAANMESYPELQKIMQDIAGEEFAHIGELQKALELVISPNASNIAEGETETEENLDEVDPGSPVDESLDKLQEKYSFLFEDTKKKSNGKWVNKGKDGEHGEFKTKKEADSQRKAMFANGWTESLDEAVEYWTPELIRDALAKHDDQVGKALVKLWERQTESEQGSRTTHEKNGQGFSSFDAEFLTSLAEFYQKYNRLSQKQLELARKKLNKYAGQLARIANEEKGLVKPAKNGKGQKMEELEEQCSEENRLFDTALTDRLTDDQAKYIDMTNTCVYSCGDGICTQCGNDIREFNNFDEFLEGINKDIEELKSDDSWSNMEEAYNEELVEALHITDDLKLIRLLDKAIKETEVGQQLTLEQRREIADAINLELHENSEDNKRRR